MPFKPGNLNVLAYANGHTQFFYRLPSGDDFRADGYFEAAGDIFASGDVITITDGANTGQYGAFRWGGKLVVGDLGMPKSENRAESDAGSYILTRSGGSFDYTNPDSSTYTLEDIAHALSHIPRFCGHTRQFYSVAQHSYMVAYLVPESNQRAALLHDASEAFMCDIPSPLKALLPDYKVIEKRVQDSIYRKFSVTPEPISILHADLQMLATEKMDLMPPDQRPWPILKNISRISAPIVPWTPIYARVAFLAAWNRFVG
jgi:hypothetical protein